MKTAIEPLNRDIEHVFVKYIIIITKRVIIIIIVVVVTPLYEKSMSIFLVYTLVGVTDISSMFRCLEDSSVRWCQPTK